MSTTLTDESFTTLASKSLWIDGGWTTGAGDEIAIVDPSTERHLATTTGADRRQVDAAVASARSSFDDRSSSWRRMAGADRGRMLDDLADVLERRAESMARLVTTEVGSPISLARAMQVAMPIANFRWLADMARRGPREGIEEVLTPHANPIASESVLRREPLGVVGALTAYNYPLNLIAWKVGGALATGCNVVLMPSPRAVLTTVAFVAALEEAGCPAGAVNLVVGGPEVGCTIAEDPRVDMFSFTGSAVVGAELMARASGTLKKSVLELGGKSPNIVLPGTDLDPIVEPSVLRFCRNAGQGCGATTRTFVHRSDHEAMTEKMAVAMSDLTVGDPHDDATDVGPLITADHRDRVQGFVDRAAEDGARVLCGGGRPQGLDRGWFFEPTLVAGAEPRSEIAQEEIFGPVGVVLPYDDLDDLVRQANGTKYALNANVWGRFDEARSIADRLRSGTVTINGGGGMRPDAPWGGPGHSGVGREMGEDGLREFYEVKHVQWPTVAP